MLIAGGSYADVPLIHAAQQLGFYVITSGIYRDELGHKESDEYCCGDYSDLEEMLLLSKSKNIDAICACCNDFSALTSAYVAEQLGLPGHDSFETSKIIHHKDKYRQFALQNNIPTPKARGFSDIKLAQKSLGSIPYPVIIKPADLTGGKGISRADNEAGARLALQRAFAISRCKHIVIEEFVEGSNHGFSAFIRDGKVAFHFSDNEHYYLNKYMVSAASTPSMAPKSALDELVKQTEKIASILELKSGIFHVQYILKNNEPIIIEICRRAPGDLYIRFVELATGINYPSWIVKGAAGLDCSALSHQNVKGNFTRHCIMSAQSGTLEKIHVNPDIRKNIIENVNIWTQSDNSFSDHLTQKFGIVFLKFDSVQEMLEKTETMQELIFAEVSP